MNPCAATCPYAVVVDMIRLRAAVMQSDSAKTVRQKLHRMVTLAYSRFGRRELDDKDLEEALQVADTIAALPAFDLDDPARSGLDDDLTEDARSALTWALATYFQRLAVSSPLQILVRDAEFMDAASRTFFAELLDFVRGAPILVIATASTQSAESLPVSLRRGAGSGVDLPFHFDKHIRLEPLSELALQQLARELLGAPIDDKLLAWLSEYAQGNAFLAAELIAALAHRRAIVTENAEWRLVRSKLPDLAPGDLEAAVRVWLLTLPEASLKVLSKAVVIGRVFWNGALEALGAEAIEGSLEVLLERGLICRNAASRYVHEQEYALTSALRWRVAYDMLAPRQRRQHHRKVAAWLASQGRTDMEEALVMAHHLELGGQPGEAALLLLRTAHAARRVGARQDAIRLYTHAHVLGDDPGVQESAERALEALQPRSE